MKYTVDYTVKYTFCLQFLCSIDYSRSFTIRKNKYYILQKKCNYLYDINDDRKFPLCAVSRQQILTLTTEGEELVVKCLEV